MHLNINTLKSLVIEGDKYNMKTLKTTYHFHNNQTPDKICHHLAMQIMYFSENEV